jgi:Putative adhesin/Domain of unknown function (DUF5668)
MASMPPQPPGNPPGAPPPPPGQPPYPPYGSPYGPSQRDYWRFQKEQNKAAWKAQRNAWKAQRDLARAQSRAMRVPSVTGPIVLIAIGIIALLLMTGRIDADIFWGLIEKWWPLLIIGLGLVALAEWAIDLRRPNAPVRRFGGYVWLIVLIIVLGAFGASWNHGLNQLRAQFGDNDNDNFFNAFGKPEHDFDQPLVSSPVPEGATVEIQNPRGDVSISTGEDAAIGIQAHQVAFANNDNDAKKIFDSQKANVVVTGKTVLVKVDSNSSGRTNLTITVPKSASVNVNSGRGAVTIAGLGGNVDADVQHGGLETTAIQGYVHAHLSNHGDFSAHDIKGDVTVDGNGGDLTLTDIHGKVIMEGDYTGDTHLERADQAVHFHSSRTDLEFARLPGDMSLDGDSLHATEVVGPVRVVCSRSKDIEMSQVSGDTHIEDRDARVELGMSGSYPVEIKNEKGDIEVSLPANAGFTVDARTHNGDIVSDFPLQTSGDEDKTATGNIGKGGPKLVLSTSHADIKLSKSTQESEAPAAPKPTAPAKPAAPGVPHLKSSKAEPAEPVNQ